MSSLTTRQQEAIDLVQEKAYMQPIFFRKLKGVKWFDELYKRGFFNPSNNHRPNEAQSWPILEYLENTAIELQQPENASYAEKVMQVIRDITKYPEESDIQNDYTWWKFSKIICFIPICTLKAEDQELFDVWLSDKSGSLSVGPVLGNKLLPRLLNADTDHSRKLALKLIRTMTVITWDKKNASIDELEPKLPVDAHFLGEIFSLHSKLIGEKLEDEGVDVFKERLTEILQKTNKDEYSSVWRPAIEDHKQNIRSNDYLNILVSIFRDSLLGYIDRRVNKASKYVSELLDSNVCLFERVAIFVIGKYLDMLKPLSEKIIDKKYFKSHYRHEIYHFLKENFQSLNDQQANIISNIKVATENDFVEDALPEIQKKQKAYSISRWLTAISGQGNEEVDLLYSENISITGEVPDHPDFSFYMVSGFSGEESLYTAKELLSRDFSGLLKILSNFKEEEDWRKPTRRGLAQSLKEALKTDPSFFKGNLNSFVNHHFDYICHIIDGYKELWSERKYDNWSELLEFCLTLIKSKDFWDATDENDDKPLTANSGWIVGSIADLIRAGTAKDDDSFNSDLLPLAEQIIIIMLDNQEGDSFESKNDAVFISINSARGKVIEALINYSLRKCRLENKVSNTHEKVWEKELQIIFNNQLNLTKSGNYEFVTLFANYLPNMLYLSRNWTIQSLPVIFDKKDRLKWLCAIEGYTYVNQIYDDIYKFLRDASHLKEALLAEEIGRTNKDKIIENIALSYFIGNETLDNGSIVIWLLDRWNYEELHQIIWFAWTQRGSEPEVINDKIMPLWHEINKRIDLTNDTDRRILSILCMWSVFINELNKENTDLLLNSAPYAELEYHSYILIEELKRLVDSYPEEVADIFYAMLENFAPTYEEEGIRYIISKLYDSGGNARDKANKICDKYITDYSIDFLAEIKANY